MFSTFRRLSEAVYGLSTAVRELVVILKEASQRTPDTGLADRLEELERSRALWEAEMQAEILKADSLKKSALNAESRARTMVKSYEANADESFAVGPRGPTEGGQLPGLDAFSGEEQGMQSMREPVALSAKDLATRAKFS